MSRGGGSHPTPLPTGPESLDVHRAIVGACDRFEAEWRAGHKPGVERAAAGVPTPMRGEVRRALAELEAELEGESASPLDTTGGTTAPIEILRPLAAGGMGQVSVAYDPEVNRGVALKEILPRGGDNAELRERFLREAQITGRLEHPGIVPVYSRGRHADGRPYYTMRLIAGDQAGTLQEALVEFHQQPAEERAERDRMWRQLLRRLIDVCNTMAYVHSRGVLHRDLKPANILLGPYGETLVVDWGLARELGTARETEARQPTGDSPVPAPKSSAPQGPTAQTPAAQTPAPQAPTSARPGRETAGPDLAGGERPGSVTAGGGTPRGTRSTHGLGTPGYASPEQLAGDRGPLTLASDVYSLGATLYAVLTGRSAFPSNVDLTPEELLRKVCAGECLRPRALNPRIEPALEAICLKAMAVDPAERYLSPAQLAAELECHLAGEPVAAWPERWTDRLRRWMAQHRTGVLLSTVGLTLSTLFFAMLAVQQGRSKRALRAEGERLAQAKQRAEQNEQLAVAALQRFGGLVASDPQLRYSRELQPLRRELLREPIAFLGTLRDSLRDVAQPSAATLWQLREATRQLAELQREIGDLGAARQLLDDELQLCAEGPGAPPGATALREADWQIAGAQARLLLARVQQQLNQPEAQLREANQARVELERLVSQFPQAAELAVDLARAEAAVGGALNALRRVPEAMTAYRSAIERQRVNAQRLPDEKGLLRDLAGLLQDLAAVLNEADLPMDAQLASDEAEARLRELDGLLLTDPLARQQRALSHYQRGQHLLRDRRQTEALAEFQRSERGWRELAKDFPARNEFLGQLRLVLTTLGNLLMVSNQANDALPIWSELIDLERANKDQSPGVPEFHGNLASALHQLGHVLAQQGRGAEVQAIYAEALPYAQHALAELPEVYRWRQLVFELNTHLADIDAERGLVTSAKDRLVATLPLARTILDSPQASATDRGGVGRYLRGLAALQELCDMAAEAAETRGLLQSLERLDPVMQQIDARLNELANGAVPIDQNERAGMARRALEVSRYDVALRLVSEALDLEPALLPIREYQLGLLAAQAATGAASQHENPRDPQAVELRRRARQWLRQELEFWGKTPAGQSGSLVGSVEGWFRNHHFASVLIPRRLEQLDEGEQREWRDLWEAAKLLVESRK